MNKKDNANPKKSNKITSKVVVEIDVRGEVIDKHNHIVSLMDRIIIMYFGPERRDDFFYIILNSEIIDFGKKVKILKNILSKLGTKKSLFQDLLELNSIRNYFAHARRTSSQEEILSESEIGQMLEYRISHHLNYMNSQGQLIREETTKLFKDFNEKYNRLNDYFNKEFIINNVGLKKFEKLRE